MKGDTKMAEVKIKNKAVEVLKVTIEDKTYSIPLVRDMKYKQVKQFKEAAKRLQETRDDDKLIELLSSFIPMEVLDELTRRELDEIETTWIMESNNAAGEGVSVGESSAS